MKYKKLIFFLFMTCIGFSSKGQTYINELISYQNKYKKDLYKIIEDDTAYVKFYPIDSSFKVTAKLEKLSNQKFFPMATSDESTHQAVKYAKISFVIMKKEYTLFAYQLSFLLTSNEYKDNFFIPFIDGSSGIDSYGGGRYIDLTIKKIKPDNTIIIDFNKAYNPYCAFRTGFSCPVPPKENYLPINMLVGEMDFSKL